MIKNIKTKETIKDIKTLDKKKMLDSFNKKQSINTKNNVQDKKENKESNYAINKIKGTSEKTLVSARIKIKKYRKLRWDTILIGIEIITVIILGLLPSSVPDQVFQVTINFICAMQFNTFRQAEKVGMATTFVTNHIRQTGSFFVRWLRKRHEKKYLNRSLRHLSMILCFIGGAIFSTVLCVYFKDRAIWGSLIFLIILQGDLLYADLVKEKELLDQVPNGH